MKTFYVMVHLKGQPEEMRSMYSGKQHEYYADAERERKTALKDERVTGGFIYETGEIDFDDDLCF